MPVLIYNQAKTDIIKSIRKDRQREVAQFDPIGMPIILLKKTKRILVTSTRFIEVPVTG
jgi:hypothetical protein